MAERPSTQRGRACTGGDIRRSRSSPAPHPARARAPPLTARRSRPEMGARRTRSGDAQPRSARARNRGRKIKRKKHRHLSVQKSAPDFHRFPHKLFHYFFVADLVVAFSHCGVPDAPAPPLRPVAATGHQQARVARAMQVDELRARRRLRGRCKSMSLKRNAGPRVCLLGLPCTKIGMCTRACIA